MQKENKVGIVIVTYNNPALIVPQLNCIKRFCKDDHDVIIVDNSTVEEARVAIEYHTREHIYIKVHSSSTNGSSSHSFAANFAHLKFKDDYSHFFYMDHDLFPTRPFSATGILDGNVMAGMGQGNGKVYFWPGCLFFGNGIDMELIDFAPYPGMDTGGGLYKVIEAYTDSCKHFGEEYFENKYFNTNNPKYSYYSMIAGIFMHFLGGSDWERVERNNERINSLLNILQERCEAS